MYWQIYKIRHIFLQYKLQIIKSFSFYKSTVYKKSAMSLNVKPDDRRMSAQKNASAFGLGFSFRGQGPILIYCLFLLNSDSGGPRLLPKSWGSCGCPPTKTC